MHKIWVVWSDSSGYFKSASAQCHQFKTAEELQTFLEGIGEARSRNGLGFSSHNSEENAKVFAQGFQSARG